MSRNTAKDVLDVYNDAIRRTLLAAKGYECQVGDEETPWLVCMYHMTGSADIVGALWPAPICRNNCRCDPRDILRWPPAACMCRILCIVNYVHAHLRVCRSWRAAT